VKATKNVTLALPEPLLRRFRIFAASRNQSMTSLIAQAIQKMVDEGGEYEKAMKQSLKNMRDARDTGLTGKIPWTRDELHER
jgi:predicted transcriptional regulator